MTLSGGVILCRWLGVLARLDSYSTLLRVSTLKRHHHCHHQQINQMPPKKHAVVKKKEKQLPAPPQATLQWPPLTPMLPSSDLELVEVLPEQILTIPKFFTSTLCKTYVNFLQKSVSLTTTPGKPKRGDAVRANDRFQIQDPEFADRLWNMSGLKDIISRKAASLWGGGQVVGLNPK